MSKSSELIYTSAPRGLRPGSRGFCTVAMSESMPAGLIGPLESLSAYRHVDGEGPSPVNFMHVQMKVAGRPVNVLSRIADAPPDYTGRTNKIAHHVVVAIADRVAGGPAAVLRQPGFAVETWDGEVQKMPEPKTIPPTDSSLRIAKAWAEQSSDAGWAGTVASIFDSQTSGAPLYLICRTDQNDSLLALIDEAICLLPESKRWNATFSTHAGELPPGVTCRMRCLIAGSPEALALPPSAMTLDLATSTLRGPTGNVNAPPPGPLVDAARSGRLASTENVASADIPMPSGKSRVAAYADQSASLEADEQSFTVAQPPPTLPNDTLPPLAGTLPPSLEADSSTERNYVVLLLVSVALLVLVLGGASAMYFLQTDSDELLAELNAQAGIEKTSELIASPAVQPKSPVEPEPEPDMERVAEADAAAAAKEAERKKTEAKKLQSLEVLARKSLDGEVFLDNDHENSITKFSTKVEKELQVLAEQNKQLKEFSLRPTDEQLATWVRAEDGMKQLTSFIDARKKDIEALKHHPPLKNLEDHRERLADQLKAWYGEAKKWEDETENRPELVLRVPDSLAVEQTILKVRETATSHLQKSVPNLLDRYGKLSSEKRQFAASIEEQLEPLQKELAADLKRRRDSHRLTIYFDGDSRRSENRLQIRPRCLIVLKPDDLKAINRLSVDDSKPIPLGQSSEDVNLPGRSDDVKLPGRFEGWLAVMRNDSGIIIKLNPKTISPVFREKYPMLQQLDRFVQNQDAAIRSETSLQNAFTTNKGKVVDGINDWRDRFRNDADRLDRIPVWEEAGRQMEKILKQSAAKELDGLYVEQADRTMEGLRSIKSKIGDVFRNLVPDVPIAGKIEEHIKNLETLRDNYLELKASDGLMDFEGQLVFGNASGNSLGQSTFETVETFELFFVPELVYGPPSQD